MLDYPYRNKKKKTGQAVIIYSFSDIKKRTKIQLDQKMKKKTKTRKKISSLFIGMPCPQCMDYGIISTGVI